MTTLQEMAVFNGIYAKEGFKLRVRGGQVVALSYALNFHLLDPIQSCS